MRCVIATIPLRALVAGHLPQPIIACHLFWEDDLGFSSDNETGDQDVVGIEFDCGTERMTRVTTHFAPKTDRT